MKLSVNGFECDLPYSLQDTVFFVQGDNVKKGKIRRIDSSIRVNSGHDNIRLDLKFIVYSGGKEQELQFGCFARSECDARTCTKPRLVRLARISGVSYLEYGWQAKDDGWRP